MGSRFAVPLCFAALLASCASYSFSPIRINGQEMTCSDVRGLQDKPDSFFDGWSDFDFDTAIRASSSQCFPYPIPGAERNKSRIAGLKSRRAEEARRQDAESRLAKARAMNACFSTKEYRLRAAALAVSYHFGVLDELVDQKKRQDAYARESGVRDLSIERVLGVRIVDTRKQIQDNFAEYKALGGKERDPVQLHLAPKPPDPCKGKY